MNIVLLQAALPLQDIELLLHEFPHYLFLSFSEATYRNLSPENWAQVEIIYGSRLKEDELSKAHQLRWIHSPEQDLNKLCLRAIEKKGNILVTAVKEQNSQQVAEYAIAAALAFSKNLFKWVEANQYPKVLWDSKWRDNMLSLDGKLFLQVGLEKNGTEIASYAEKLGMRVWGVSQERSFHPHCLKNFSFNEIQTPISKADIICLSLPKNKKYEGILGSEELALIKDDAILIILGNPKMVDEQALAKEAERFRGILFDSMYQTPLSTASLLWEIPNVIISPDVSPRPKSHISQSFALFKYNLRQYIHGNYKDLRNVIDLASLSAKT